MEKNKQIQINASRFILVILLSKENSMASAAVAGSTFKQEPSGSIGSFYMTQATAPTDLKFDFEQFVRDELGLTLGVKPSKGTLFLP